MQEKDGNGRTVLKTLVEFEAPSYVPLSLSSDKRWLAYGDEGSGSIFIGKWKNRSPHLSNVRQGPDVAHLRTLEWSPDSKRLLAVSNATAHLLEPNSPTTARSFQEFEEIGIAAAVWSYDSTFVIIIDSCCTSTAVLGIDESVHWLSGVRISNNKPLLALRPDSKALAMWAFQADIGEALMVYRCADWSSILIIRPHCVLVSGICWFPNSGALVVWDSIARNRVECFHPDGSVRHIISPADVTEEGVRSLAVSPCSSLIAVFNNNFNIFVYSTSTWRPVCLFDISNYTETPGYFLPTDSIQIRRVDSVARLIKCYQFLTKTAGGNWAPFLGWSTCGEYLLFSSTASSRAYVWSKSLEDTFQFDFDGSITDMAWHPKKPKLAVATETQEIWLLKSHKSDIENNELGMNASKLASDRSIPLREIRWVGINPTYLVVRSKNTYVAVTSVR